MTIRLTTRIAAIAVLTCLAFASHAQTPDTSAQDSELRLREALRQAIGQTRALEDERAKLQTRVMKSEADAAKFKKENTELNLRLKQLRQYREEEKKEFERRIAERDETLTKWKDAYTEAATLARTKEGERLKLDTEVTALKPALKTCQTRNAELVKISSNILRRFDQVDLLEVLERKEPALGLRKVEVENEVQDYRNKVLDRREIPEAKK